MRVEVLPIPERAKKFGYLNGITLALSEDIVEGEIVDAIIVVVATAIASNDCFAVIIN